MYTYTLYVYVLYIYMYIYIMYITSSIIRAPNFAYTRVFCIYTYLHTYLTIRNK